MKVDQDMMGTQNKQRERNGYEGVSIYKLPALGGWTKGRKNKRKRKRKRKGESMAEKNRVNGLERKKSGREMEKESLDGVGLGDEYHGKGRVKLST